MNQTFQNLALKNAHEQEILQVDMAAAGVAYKEKYGQAVNTNEIKKLINVEFHAYFHEKLEYYRKLSQSLGRLESIED